MASFGVPTTEMAESIGCDEGTIRKRFSEIIRKEKAGCTYRLRQAQINAALAGNTTMLVWLGKQMLGQSDKLDVEQTDTRTYNFLFSETEPKAE